MDTHSESVVPAPIEEAAAASLKWWGLAVLGLLLVAASVRWAINVRHAQDVVARTDASIVRTVSIIQPKAQTATRNATLPTTLRGYQEASIVARTNGYVSHWYKTIGDHVKQGELLAQLSAPEQEQELLQARARRQQLNARADLTHTSLARWEAQHAEHLISVQLYEEKRSEDLQAQADLAEADANIRRLENLLALQKITAPFDGVISKRTVETGVLVTAGGRELFAISQTDQLRLSVWVPQLYAADVAPGQEVHVAIRGLPGRSFVGKIEHVSGAIDVATNSRQVDVVLPNKDGTLIPGAYADVELSLSDSLHAFLLPPNALIFGKDGPRVLLVDDDNRLAYRTVELGRDLGKQIEVLAGISTNDRIVINPSDLLYEGETVVPQVQASSPRLAK